MPFRVALVQQKAEAHDPEENARRGVRFIREAKALGADLVLFPEMWSNAYAPPFEEAFDDPFRPGREEERRRWREQAVSPDSAYVAAFREAARENRIGVCATFLSAGDPRPRNTALVIGRTGEPLMRYDKVHTCAFSLEALLEPGDAFRVCTFDGVKLGVMICYDREFPESARVLMLKGAELILVPNACPIDPARFHQLAARAYENMTGVAMANYPAPGWGHSCAFTPQVYDEEGQYRDPTLAEAADTEETLLLADFDLESLRRYREREPWGNAYRRVDAYGPLLSREVRPPFIREPLIPETNNQ